MDSAGVYFISVEEFESRARPKEQASDDEKGTAGSPDPPTVESPQKR
jgi:hypothetical protein